MAGRIATINRIAGAKFINGIGAEILFTKSPLGDLWVKRL